MINIYRSSNAPIVINFNTSLENIEEIEVAMYNDNNISTLIQSWTKEDMVIQGDLLYIPLTQTETSNFPVGIGHLEVKWLNTDGEIIFANPESITFKTPMNMSILGQDTVNNPTPIINLEENKLYGIKPISLETIDSFFED